MAVARITAKGQTTIPKPIRDQLGLRVGDVVRFAVEGDRAVLQKIPVPHADRADLQGIEGALDEWLSESDEAAFREL